MKIEVLIALSSLALVLASGCERTMEKDHPSLVGQPPTMVMHLPARLESALESSGHGFRTYTIAEFDSQVVNDQPGWRYPFDPSQAPFGVIGDFDGDRRWDCALLQHSDTESRFVVVLDKAAAPEVIELQRASLGPESRAEKLWWFLVRVPAGEIPVPNWETGTVDTTFILANDAVEIVYFEKAAVMHYYENGSFVAVSTAD